MGSEQLQFYVDVTNQVFGPPNAGFDNYLVDDVVVGGGGWIIDSVTGYFQASSPHPATGTAVLNIFSETAILPTAGNNPTTGTTVNVSYTLIAGIQYAVSASALNISLAPGNYWIGLTPISPFSAGQVYQYTTLSAVIGNAAWINPANGFGFGSGWQPASNPSTGYGEAAMLIAGTTTAPEPATILGTAGGLIALGFLGRRRA